MSVPPDFTPPSDGPEPLPDRRDRQQTNDVESKNGTVYQADELEEGTSGLTVSIVESNSETPDTEETPPALRDELRVETQEGGAHRERRTF